MTRFRKCLTALYLGISWGISLYSGFTPATAAERTAADLESLVIDQLELVGVTVFNESDLEKVLELAPGDRLERRKIVRTAQNLHDLYRRHGYEEVRVRTQLNQRSVQRGAPIENILEISVFEGKPTRVANLEISVSDPQWARKIEALGSRLGVAKGEIFDQEKLANGYRSFQDAVASYDFMGVKMHEAKVATASPPADLPTDIRDATARWVSITVKVDLGERVTFGFQGNEIFPATQLKSWVEEQRLLGFSQDYQVRIQSRIEDEYRKLGYDRVRVEIYTFEQPEQQHRHVTYRITEGPRVRLGEVNFDGNLVFQEDLLREKFFDNASILVQRGYFVSKEIDHAAEVLIEWMKSKGYLGAKLISVARSYNPEQTKASVLIYIYEGEQTIVRGVDFKNLSLFPPEELLQALRNREGQPLNLYDFNEGLEVIKALYRDRGYLDFKIENEGTSEMVLYSDENRVADIVLNLNEGVQYRVSRIEITGLRKTEEKVVLRELLVREGDVLEERKWIDSETRLRRLGIFASVSIKAHADPDRRDGKVLQVVVEEGSPGLIAGGIGARNDLGARVFGQISYSNLWGKNHTVSLTGNANRRFGGLGSQYCANPRQIAKDPHKDWCFIEFDVQLGYIWPWAVLGETTFRPRLSFERTQYRQFDATTASMALSLQRTFIARPNLQGIFTYSLERVNQFDAVEALDDQKLRIGSITPALILDMRDDRYAPTKGMYTQASFELARPEFFSQKNPVPVAYSRFQYRLDGYVPLPKDIHTFLSFRTGIAYNLSKDPTGSDDPRYQIPLIKQFALGGVNSVRGFEEQSLAIPSNIAVRGYMSYVNYRAQVDFPFAGQMKFGPFIDAANVLLDNYSFTNGIRYGVGGGFHYQSPVGPVNFDIGVNPNPRENEDEYQLHFSIGTI